MFASIAEFAYRLSLDVSDQGAPRSRFDVGNCSAVLRDHLEYEEIARKAMKDNLCIFRKEMEACKATEVTKSLLTRGMETVATR